MSKTGYYIGGHSVNYANPKKVGYVADKPFPDPKRDIIADMRKETRLKARKAKAEKITATTTFDSTTIKAWSKEKGVVVRQYKKKKK